MNSLYRDILKRNIPDVFTCESGEKVTSQEQWLKRREEIKKILCENEYGYLPEKPISMSAEILEQNREFCGGKLDSSKVLLKTHLKNGDFSFPVNCSFPKGQKNVPAFISLNFEDPVPNKYLPIESICNNGFAVLSICYNDITSDNGDFGDGLAGVLFKNGERGPADCGKIALWAWAAMRAMDLAQTLPEVRKDRIAVAGHSRLGKTALVAGAFDERFYAAFSNDSGCSGAAVSRGKAGETVEKICETFGYWFCDNYRQYIKRESEMPFDQNYLLSLIAPRKVYAASASEDLWADPKSEFINCFITSQVYSLYGLKGLVCPEEYPKPGDVFNEGNIGYHLREGTHFFSAYDWEKYMEYMRS